MNTSVNKEIEAEIRARKRYNHLVDGVPAQTLANVCHTLAVLQAVDYEDASSEDVEIGVKLLLDMCRKALEHEVERMEVTA